MFLNFAFQPQRGPFNVQSPNLLKQTFGTMAYFQPPNLLQCLKRLTTFNAIKKKPKQF